MLLAKRLVCRSCYMTSFTGSTYHSGSTSSCVQLFISASSARPHHIWSTYASQYQTLPAGSAYTIRQQPPTLYTALSSLDVRPSGLLCCWPYGLEHTSRRPSRRGIATTYFQSQTKNSAVLILLAHQRIRGLTAAMCYINLRLTLALTLT